MSSAAAEPGERTIVCGVAYDGRRYAGYQRQHEQRTVQGELERALSTVAAEVVQILAAGRTDAGVHATGQVISFRTTAERSNNSWRRGANSLLAKAGERIAITWVASADASFHARFSAHFRRYLYLLEEPIPDSSGASTPFAERSPFTDGLVTPTKPLNLDLMNAAARHLVGEQDYSALRASGCQSATPWRCVHHVRCRRLGRYVVVDVQANAFLLHMVRNLVGLLLSVSDGVVAESSVPELLQRRDRSALPKTAPAAGLYLAHVGYPDLPASALAVPALLGALTSHDALF